MLIRTVDSTFTFANFMRLQLYSAVSALKYGLDILFKEENVPIDKMYGHGGFFKTKGVGQRIMSAAMHAPVSVMDTAGEGGAWGIAVLALYSVFRKTGQSLPDYLEKEMFSDTKGETLEASKQEMDGFDAYMERYCAAFPVLQSAIDNVLQ